MSTDHCQSCGAEVRFALSTNDRWMILDAKPEQRAVIRLVDLAQRTHDCRREACDPDGHRGYRAVMERTYLDHHVSCPRAEQWRGRRRGGGQ